MCVCVGVCVVVWPKPCASKEQVWGGIPALPVAHLCGRLCAACALSVPMPDRAGKPGLGRGGCEEPNGNQPWDRVEGRG